MSNITKAFSVDVIKKDGSTEKLNFAQKFASKQLAPIYAETSEFDALNKTGNIDLADGRGKVTLSVKPKILKYLQDNNVSNFPNAKEPKINEATVDREEIATSIVIPGFDQRLSEGLLGNFLALKSAEIVANFKLTSAIEQYKRFDSAISSKTKKLYINGSGNIAEKNISALAAGKTLAQNITYLEQGGRKIDIKLSELSTEGNFLKLFNKLIKHITHLPHNETNEYLPRRLGAIPRSKITVYIDEEYLKYFREGNNILLPANVNAIDNRITKYNGINLVFKTLGTKPIYIVVDGTYSLKPIDNYKTEIGGTANAIYAVEGGNRKLLPGEKVYTLTATQKFIKPDELESLVWSIETSA